MKNLPSFFCLPFVLCFSLLLPLSSLLLSQEYDDREYRALAQRKPIVDYYETVNDKSFYQLKRIHGMKGELNSYSEKLHNLQDRFDKIFYGLSSKGNFQTPFDTTMQPARPVVQPRTAAVMPKMEAPTQITPRYQEPVEQAPPENQLAFNVDSRGKYSRNDQSVSSFSPDKQGGSGYDFLFKSTLGCCETSNNMHRDQNLLEIARRSLQNKMKIFSTKSIIPSKYISSTKTD